MILTGQEGWVRKRRYKMSKTINRENDGREKSPWEKVEAVLKQHFHQPDTEPVRAAYSAIAAHRLAGQPVWAMLVAPPGSLKTEGLNAIKGLPGVHTVDQV